MKGRLAPQSKVYPDIGRVDYHPGRQRNIRLSLHPGRVRVSYPYTLGQGRAEKFLLSRRDWVVKHRRPARQLVNGMLIGASHRLSFSESNHRIEAGVIYAPKRDEVKTAKLIRQALKLEAETKLLPLAELQISKTGLKPKLIRLRYMSSQWGSCTSRSNICLNTALVYLPDSLIEYVIIHELCHLRFLNHSPRFWRAVAEHYPNHAMRRQQLKNYKIDLVAETLDGYLL